MQGTVKIPQIHSKPPFFLLTDNVSTTILPVPAYCLDVMPDFFSLQRLLFLFILITKCVFSLPSLLPFQTFIIQFLLFLLWPEKKINCICSNRPITSSQSIPSLCFLPFRCSNKYVHVYSVSPYKWDFPFKHSENLFPDFSYAASEFFSCYGVYIDCWMPTITDRV